MRSIDRIYLPGPFGLSVAPEEAPESLFCSGFRSKNFAEERRGEPTGGGRRILRGWYTPSVGSRA